MSCLNNTFKGSLQNLQLPLLGSCMAPVVEPLSTTPGGKSIAVRISVIGNAVQIPTLPLITKKNLQLLRPIMSLSHYGPFATATQSFNSPQRQTLPMTKSINITETGLWLMRELPDGD